MGKKKTHEKLEWPASGLKVEMVPSMMLSNKIQAVYIHYRSCAHSERNALFCLFFCCDAAPNVGVETGHDMCFMFPACLMVQLFPRVHSCLRLQRRILPHIRILGSVPLLLQLSLRVEEKVSFCLMSYMLKTTMDATGKLAIQVPECQYNRWKCAGLLFLPVNRTGVITMLNSYILPEYTWNLIWI